MDRLSALMSRFELTVAACARHEANFLIVGRGEGREPTYLLFAVTGKRPGLDERDCDVLLSAHVSWGGSENPLLAALPAEVRHSLSRDAQMRALVNLLLTEQSEARCGMASVLSRLAEVLLVRLMRAQIEQGAMQVGLLGGLADSRLSRAILAMHNDPGHAWRVESLASEAGLSVSRFAELFKAAVGITPLAYLRRWRLTLARQDIERGERVQRVAHRYCYGSTEALSRAITQAYGATPRELRKVAVS